jgi:hypothetical protein
MPAAKKPSSKIAQPKKLRRMSVPPTETTTKMADSKGRVLLGERFANRTVLVEQLSPTEVLLKLARVIPEREAWLYENPRAIAAVRAGLSQAREGRLNSGPDVQADSALAAALED